MATDKTIRGIRVFRALKVGPPPPRAYYFLIDSFVFFTDDSGKMVAQYLGRIGGRSASTGRRMVEFESRLRDRRDMKEVTISSLPWAVIQTVIWRLEELK